MSDARDSLRASNAARYNTSIQGEMLSVSKLVERAGITARVMSSGRFSARPRRPPRPRPAIIVEALTAEDAEDAEVAQGEVNNYETT